MDNGNVITTSLQAYLEIQSRHSKCSQAGKSSTWCSPSSSVLNTELCKSNTGYFFFNCFLGKKKKTTFIRPWLLPEPPLKETEICILQRYRKKKACRQLSMATLGTNPLLDCKSLLCETIFNSNAVQEGQFRQTM